MRSTKVATKVFSAIENYVGLRACCFAKSIASMRFFENKKEEGMHVICVALLQFFHQLTGNQLKHMYVQKVDSINTTAEIK